MNFDLKLYGYRCFPPAHPPATLEFRQDIVAVIGLNNSGKSTLLKSIYELRSIFSKLRTNTDEFRAGLEGQDLPFEPPAEIFDSVDLFWHHSDDDIGVIVTLVGVGSDLPSNSLPEIAISLSRTNLRWRFDLRDGNGQKIQVVKQGWRITNDVIFNGSSAIGTVAGLFQAFSVLAECFYVPAVRHISAFSPEAGSRTGSFFDMKIGKPFIEQWHYSQQGDRKEPMRKVAGIVQDIQRIFRYKQLQIFARQDNRELIVTADQAPMKLGELGSGLSQFIVLLGNIAFLSPSYLLIDEPESNLHPALQLDFLQALAARTRHGMVFATHSLALARQAADRVYSVSQRGLESRISSLLDTPNLASLVAEMSFGRFESVGARKLLLVEGQSDVLVFEVFLAMLGKEHEFSILSLGGQSGIHENREHELAHILAINPSTAAIIDSEKAAEDEPLSGNRFRFVQMCNRLGLRCNVLGRRATENYLTDTAIKALYPYCRALAPFEDLKAVQHHWPKKRNWRIAQRMVKEDLLGSDLWKFLEEL